MKVPITRFPGGALCLLVLAGASLSCEPEGQGMFDVAPVDGSDTEVDAVTRLADYREYSRYPQDSRPARDDTPGRLDDWPGVPAETSDSARITAYAGERVQNGSLFVDVEVAVRDAGRYSFLTVLRDREGPVAVATVTRDLTPGTVQIPLEFYGLILRERYKKRGDVPGTEGQIGPFAIEGVIGERILSDADIEAVTGGTLKSSPAGRLDPPWRERYRTRAYPVQTFTDRVWDGAEKRRRIAELEAEVRAEAAAKERP